MSGTISLVLDRQRRLLTYVAEGFFDEADVGRLATQKLALLRSLGGDMNDHLTLADVSGCKIQGQVVAAQFATLIADKRSLARRMAFVTGSGTLIRMQVRRLIQGIETAQLFADRTSAEAWLFDCEPLALQA